MGQFKKPPFFKAFIIRNEGLFKLNIVLLYGEIPK